MTPSRATTEDEGLDRVLDRAVVLGYSRLGYAIRRRRWAAADPRPGALAGRTALVTGGGSGLGAATVLGLARLGARVHVLVRSPERAATAVARIEQQLGDEGLVADLRIERCDVSDLSVVDAFADDLCTRDGGTTTLDVLVHNAGVMPPERTESVDGHELTVATHVLGPIRLTERLLPALRRSEHGARVVFVASGGMYTQPLPVDDPEFQHGSYRGAVAYARSKRMQVELAPLLDRRWSPDRISTYVMHPGWADTPGLARSLPAFRTLSRPLLRSAEAGADTAVWLGATDPAPPSGTFWHDRRQRPTSYRSATRPEPGDTDELWRWVAAAAGVDRP
ncbi:SDR family NAD(P)-dependent oxidoreductase [Nocardioides panzhihuensis]|uniref:NAD(P)-dependent dehydrogenase (Short-subunit alcohol dehydrogenase family) n=1 Tax=Nocardioides panzhihuensis TaxID=860243 RepID=A0A7Z0ITR4_9ACTN|nr:SDR family NAD(P)-dependent oxidoreductase [Nocardioides panzhihuensis]NYI79132.1 NAD(P)-dependent dehydrogenase (short-subunit alcohol dehydrogenase family) [Nocardioides panzhihuensis]